MRCRPGLIEGSDLPEPIFTPTTKVPPGEGHDEFMTYAEVEAKVGRRGRCRAAADHARGVPAGVGGRGRQGDHHRRHQDRAGVCRGGALKLGDELLTPDSSRFWAADEWKPGGTQRYLDKQFLRDWSSSLTGWDRTAPGPEIPEEVVEATRNRYIEVYERLTGDRWS